MAAAGYFGSSLYSSVTFGSVVLYSSVTYVAGSYTGVVWKMSGEGTTLWAVRGGGTSRDAMQAVAVDGAGGVVAAGFSSSSTATFGAGAYTRSLFSSTQAPFV